MNPTPQELEQKMSEKPGKSLFEMLQKPDDWTPEALQAAREEITRRGLPYPPPSVPNAVTGQPPDKSLESQPQGKFFEVKLTDGTLLAFPDEGKIVEAVINGEVTGDCLMRTVVANADAAKNTETNWKSVATSIPAFRPVRAHLWKGAGIGAMTGLILFLGFKTADMAFAAVVSSIPQLFGAALVFAFFFAQMLAAAATSFPESVRKLVEGFSNLVMKGALIGGVLLAVNLGGKVFQGAGQAFMGLFFVFLIGSVLGAFLGMPIGTLVGMIRRPRLPKLPQAPAENIPLLIGAGMALPLALFVAASYVYVARIVPWATDSFVESLK